MNVKTLIEYLSNYPDDMKVAINCSVSEDQDMPSRVKLYDKESCPYAKGDNVWMMHNINDDEAIVFIE